MMRRYFMVRIYSDSAAITGDQFLDALMASVRKYFGDVGVSTIDPKLLRFDSRRSEAIIACQKNHEAELQAAVALIKDIAGTQIAPLTLRVSGTIKGLTTSS